MFGKMRGFMWSWGGGDSNGRSKKGRSTGPHIILKYNMKVKSEKIIIFK